MVKSSSDCLLDELCEIIIPVQILVTYSYTRRPCTASLLVIPSVMISIIVDSRGVKNWDEKAL